MKRFKLNKLLNVELEVTPLTQDAEGKLLGGFVGMQGNANGMTLNKRCDNIECKNYSCANEECINERCDNANCINRGCILVTTETPTPTVTDTTTVTSIPEFHFF